MDFEKLQRAGCGAVNAATLIHITVGGQPGHTSSSVLRKEDIRLASTVLAEQIKSQESITSPDTLVTLSFPQDRLEVWTSFVLFNSTEDHSPDSQEEKTTSSLVQQWMVGERYGMRDFQNEAMSELLDFAVGGKVDIAREVIELVLTRTSTSSPSQKLFAEELIQLLRDRHSTRRASGNDGVPGLLGEILEAQRHAIAH